MEADENQKDQYGENGLEGDQEGMDEPQETESEPPQDLDPKESQQEGPFDFASLEIPEDLSEVSMDHFYLMGIDQKGKEQIITFNPKYERFNWKSKPQQLKV